MRIGKKCVSVLLAVLTVLTVMLAGAVPGTVKTEAAGWNGWNYGGGTLYGYQTILDAYGIDYDVYMKWLDDHDKDSPNPDYYLGTPYVGQDHRNPHGDCQGAYGAYDVPGREGLNCTGFVWHVLYKAAVHSGASRSQINRLGVMGGVLSSWSTYGVYRIWFNSLEDAYDSGVMEKGDVMWIYGSKDNHNAIFYGDDPHDWMYWDSAGERNRYCEIHAIGACRGLWVCKVTRPHKIELKIDTASGGRGTKFGTKYMVFDSKAKAQACINASDDDPAWEEREGTIVLDSDGHGCFRTQKAPTAKELWSGDKPVTNHSYFKSGAQRVSCSKTYYAVQWSHSPGISEDHAIHEFKDSGQRTPSGYRVFRFIAPIRVDDPAFSEIKSVSDGIRMKWQAVKGAGKYRIYYKNSQGSWTRMAETSSTSYLDTDVRRGKSYTYTIRCVDKYGNFISDYNTKGWKGTYQYLDTPGITDLTDTPEGVKISWNAVENTINNDPIQYRVYYKNSKGGWTRIAQTDKTSCTDAAVGEGKQYTYTVRCVDKDGDFISKYNTDGWQHTFNGTDAPQITETISEPDGVRIRWNAVEGVAKYRVYYKNKAGEWKKMSDVAGTEYFDDDVSPGTTYTYSVRCINSQGYTVSGMNKTGWKCQYIGVDTPQITSIQSDPDGVRMRWDPVEGAVKYRVYYKNSKGSWVKVAETAGTEYLDEEIKLNQSYYYTVRCVNNRGKFMSDYNKTGWKGGFEGIPAPQITEAYSDAEGVHLKWNVAEGASKYRVYYKSKTGEWKSMGDTADTEFLDDDVAEGTEYTYSIRCINHSGRFSSPYAQEFKYTYAPVNKAIADTGESIEINEGDSTGSAVLNEYPEVWE
ncbi:MAG: hypothetical protein IJG87_06980 [Ruminococcus sp.]|nr:hypothetical protein [Ruminococcus sp.]